MASTNSADYIPLALSSTFINETDGPQSGRLERPSSGRRRPVLERTGKLNLLILLLGSILLLVPWTLLGFVWQESMTAISGEEPNFLFVRLVNANWASRLVTVCTAVIRTIVALQASVVTAMLSSVILEKAGTALLYAPLYSIIRAVSVSPTSLLLTKGILARSKTLLSILIALVIILEVLVTVGSQFLSTIFISDFMTNSYRGGSNSTEVGILRSTGVTPPPWWTGPPASSWTFGETPGSFSEGPDFHDTGHTYRAFLPLKEERQRTSLRSFHGPAPVMDQRVVCVPPTFHDLRLNTTFPPRIYGQMRWENETYPMLQGTVTQRPINFTCAIPYPPKNKTYGISSICHSIMQNNIQLKDPLVNVDNENGISGVRHTSDMIFVLDITDPEVLTTRESEFDTGPYQVNRTLKEGPWTKIMNGSESKGLRVSACFTNLVSKTFTVSMTSSQHNLEPRLSWDRDNESFNTQLVRQQLGATLASESLKDRGILSLNPKADWEDFDMGTTDGQELSSIYLYFQTTFLTLITRAQLSLTSPGNPLADPGILLSERNTQDTSIADQSYTDIFKDILHETQSPALALQALITRGCQALFYEEQMRQVPVESALTVFSSEALIPAQWDGFIISASIVVVHVIILVLVSILFVFHTRGSMIGNTWQAVAQLVSKDTLPILEEASKQTDGEVERHWGKGHLASPSSLRCRSDGRATVQVESDERYR
ncbi:uncharacterized protein BDV14DRAFT_179423 [Aspergillus stella-maris]|uniref:uncharacterized protein n=1 Tax=Aspergillus stella-maris TaxID=1810926 RepID=UPI003CCD5943